MDVDTRFLEIEHLGGPYDGQTVRIAADEDGNPPELYILNDMGAVDWAVDPAGAPQSQIATQFYERDVALRGDRMTWVYVWKGEHLSEAA